METRVRLFWLCAVVSWLLGSGPNAWGQCSLSTTISPAGPLGLPAGGTQTLTASSSSPAFNVGGSGFGGVVFTTVQQPDGKLLFGGSFTSYNGVACPNGVVRLNADGSLDQSFNPGGSGTNSIVRALQVEPDGQIVVGGIFTSYNGVTAAPDGLLRLNADGSLDAGFNVGGAGLNTGGIYALGLDGGGRILAGGADFSAYNGSNTSNKRLIRLNPDGSLDPTFNVEGYGSLVADILIQPDGRILVAGQYYGLLPSPGGFTTYGLARFNTDGSYDPTFNLIGPGAYGRGFNNETHTLALQPDGKILVGGFFSSYNSATVPNKVARFTSGGLIDPTFNTGGSGVNGASSTVINLALEPDGQILLGGLFSSYNGAATPQNVIRLNTTGFLDAGFNATRSGAVGIVRSLLVEPGGTLLVGGDISSYNGTALSRLARLNADGSLNTTATPLTTGVSYTWSTGATGSTLNVTQPGSYSVTATYGGCVSTAGPVTVTSTAPVISGISPAFTRSGQTVTISGQNLSGATALTFSGVSQPSFTVNAAGTQLTATVPYANMSSSPDLPSGPVQVTTPTGTATSATPLRLLAVTAASAGWGGASGLSGDNVTITGTGFVGATVRYVLGPTSYPVTYTVVGETQITTTVPDISGTLSVGGNGGFVVTNTPGLSGANFEVLSPVLSSISPSSGPAGTVVTVTGFNFQRNDPRFGFPQPTQITGLTFNGVPGTNFQLLSPTQARATVPAGASTGYVRPSGGTLQEGNSRGLLFTVPTPQTTWTGTISTDWAVAGNWTQGVPTATLDALLPSGLSRYPALTASSGSVRDLTLQGGSSLTLQNTRLDLYGNLLNQGGTLTAVQSSTVLKGSSAQTLGGSSTTRFLDLEIGAAGATLAGPVQIERSLRLDGNLVSNGQLTLLSDATGTALVINPSGGGVVSGPATVQRYLSPGSNPGLGYRHLSAPVQGSTVADLGTSSFGPVVNPAYNSSATPNLVTPFPTVFGYDEQRLTASNATTSGFDFGWVSPGSLGDALAVGRGYTVNLAPQMVDFTGVLNNGPVSVPLSRGTTTGSGWHLLGNPYPAPIDWDLLTRPAGIANALYVYRSTGQYSGGYVSYVNGVGPAGANLIGMGQGFFVRATAPATFAFSNAARLTTPQPVAVYRGPETRPLLQLTVQAPSGSEDALYVYRQAGASANFDAAFDAWKLQLNGGPQPTLYLRTPAGEPLTIQGLPIDGQPYHLPLTVQAPAAGLYSFALPQLLNFGPAAGVWLEDTQTGRWHDLRQGAAGIVLGAGLASGRLVLHLDTQRPLATGAGHRSPALTLQVYPNPSPGRTIQVVATGVAGRPADLQIVSSIGQVVHQQPVPSGNSDLTQELALPALPAGVYAVQLRTAAGTLVRKLILN